jgi:hypothetical protein
MKKILAIVVIMLVIAAQSFAQCPMCRMTAESNLQNGGTAGSGLNAGILYMLVAPYIIVGGIAVWWWRNRKKESEAEEQQQQAWLRPQDEVNNWN